MPKYLTLEISREQFAQVTVLVPDDFEEQKLARMKYAKAILAALDDQEPEWDDDDANETVSVASIKVEEEQEAKQYAITDLCAAIAACDRVEAEHNRLFHEYQAAKSKEGGAALKMPPKGAQ